MRATTPIRRAVSIDGTVERPAGIIHRRRDSRARNDVGADVSVATEDHEHYDHENRDSRRMNPDRTRARPVYLSFPNEYFERILSEPFLAAESTPTH